ncbi:MAG: spermidine/putrescine ABC transporter substrate-binding protein [Chloroflexi bacterium]|nr:spermidine/putrescine ABC transporter substrate-binding protein [Chloroflexota bacterium]
MRKIAVLVFSVFIIVAIVAPVTPHPTLAQEGATTWTCPEGYAGQTLSVYGWATYIGSNTIPDFEKLCDVTVLYDVTDGNENTLTRLREGNPGWDVIIITDYIVQTMVEQDLLEPINYDLIPNWANIGDTFKGRSYDPENTYTVPYQWGTTGVGYNVDAVGEEITSWEQVWDHDGPVSWPEDPRYMIGVGLQMLGYDPNTTNEDEIAEAAEYLVEHGSNVVAITPDDGQVLLAGGNVDIALEYSGDIVQIIQDCECDDFGYALPEEGANLFIDNLAIPTDAPNADLANVFIDYILDPQVGADISNEIGYGSPNQASLDLNLIDEEYLNNGITYPDEATMEHLWTVDANPDQEEAYIDAWDQITIFVGQ